MSIFPRYFFKSILRIKNWRGEVESLLKNGKIEWLRLLNMLFLGWIYIALAPGT